MAIAVTYFSAVLPRTEVNATQYNYICRKKTQNPKTPKAENSCCNCSMIQQFMQLTAPNHT